MIAGIVTYQVAAEWNLDEIIANCAEIGLRGVELRAGHRHGVEVSLGARARQEVRRKFAGGPVALAALGSAFEFHSADRAELAANIAGAAEYLKLAADVGAPAIKVRPNALPAGVPPERTISQVAGALRQVAGTGEGLGVRTRLEVHGRGTSCPAVIRRIMEEADHPWLGVCWNSNPGEKDGDGSIARSFEMLRQWVEIVHIHELWEDYPWRELFELLGKDGFEGYCLAEIPACPEPLRLLRYYLALFRELSRKPGERPSA